MMPTERKETLPDELRTLTAAPDVMYLDIGMKGQLYEYRLVQPSAKRKKASKPKPSTNKGNSPATAKKGFIGKLLGA